MLGGGGEGVEGNGCPESDFKAFVIEISEVEIREK